MGRVTINSENGSGNYRTTYAYDHTNEDARIADIDTQFLTLIPLLVSKFNQVDAIQDQLDVIYADLEILIDDLVTCAGTPGCDIAPKEDAIVKKTTTKLEGEGLYNIAYAEYLGLRAIELALIKEKAFIQNYDIEDESLDLWSATYALGRTGAVPTAELSNHKKHGVVILPVGVTFDACEQGEMSSVYNFENKDTIQKAAHAYHYAMELGNANFAPKYFAATITNIDYTLDQCNLSITGVGSNPFAFVMNNVGIGYLTCDSRAFTTGDTVLVKLTSDFTADNPIGNVIGFIDNPKQCPYKLTWAGETISVPYIGTETETWNQGLICGSTRTTDCNYDFSVAGNESITRAYNDIYGQTIEYDTTHDFSWTQSRGMTASEAGCPNWIEESIWSENYLFTTTANILGIGLETFRHEQVINQSITLNQPAGTWSGNTVTGHLILKSIIVNYTCSTGNAYQYTKTEERRTYVNTGSNTYSNYGNIVVSTHTMLDEVETVVIVSDTAVGSGGLATAYGCYLPTCTVAPCSNGGGISGNHDPHSQATYTASSTIFSAVTDCP